MKPFIVFIFLVGASLVLMGCPRQADLSFPEPPGPLNPCPASPNCVATQAADPQKRMAPLPYRVDRATSRTLLVSILMDMPRATVVTDADHYLHVEFRSALFGFVDDVEFVFDDAAAVIHFRSAARSGYWDLGVNRRRMNAIAEAYRNALLDNVAGAAAMIETAAAGLTLYHLAERVVR